MVRCLLGLAVVLLLCSKAAAAPVVLDARTSNVFLAGHMEVLRDDTGRLMIEDVTGRVFSPVSGSLAAGFDRSAFWLRIPLERKADSPPEWLLEIEMPYLDHVDLYAPEPGGGFSVVKLGDRLPFDERALPYRNALFKLKPSVGSSQIYLRVQSTSTIVVRGTLWTPDAFGVMAGREGVVQGLVHGAMMIVVLSALVQFLVTRQRTYGLYVLYTASLELTFASMTGLGGQFLFPHSPVIADAMTGASVCLAAGCGAFLGGALLDMARRHPWIYRSYIVFGTLACLAASAAFVDKYHLVAKPVHLLVLYLCVMQTVVALLATLKGDREATAYLLAWLFQLISLSLVVLRNLGVPFLAAVPDMVAQAASLFHVVALSGGLALRVLASERDKTVAQVALLEESRRVERELEARVGERTSELAAENAERRAAEAQLRESEAHLRAMLDAAPFPMVVTKMPEGTMLFVNGPAEALFGLESGVGGSCASYEFYDDTNIRQELVERLRTEGVVVGAEVMLRRADGGRIWVMLSAVRFRYGGEDAIMSCLNDISARKQLEQSLIDARERSDAALVLQQQAMAEQRNFLAMISHEFRTPLAIIGAASDLMGLMDEHDGRFEPNIAKIRRAIVRMADLIDTCLADEWVASTMPSLREKPLELVALLHDVVNERREIAPQRLVLSLASEPLVVHGDASLLRVAMSNLVDNAIKYSPPEGSIRLTLRRAGDQAALTVSDDGAGVAPEDAPQIFEKFYRSDSARDRGGAGLGLYLVKQIAERHGGSIRLDASSGAGASFTLDIPLK